VLTMNDYKEPIGRAASCMSLRRKWSGSVTSFAEIVILLSVAECPLELRKRGQQKDYYLSKGGD